MSEGGVARQMSSLVAGLASSHADYAANYRAGLTMSFFTLAS